MTGAAISPHVTSFPPIADVHAEVLILGSMPGRASLDAGQYYAHPQNVFWRIMGDLLGAGPDLDYAARVQKLRTAGVAVWDVLAACARPGSLDADIEAATVVVNDFAAFMKSHSAISRVFFNGAAAEKFYRRHVPAQLGDRPIQYQRLPSTSPAHAGLRYAEKLDAWQVIVRARRVGSGRPGIGL